MKFLKGHVDNIPRKLAQAYIRERPKEVFLATESVSILGFSNLQRVTSGTAAVANLRIAKRQGMLGAASLLIGATAQRARETLHRSISCIESRGGQPSASTLKACGFDFWFEREVFSGRTSKQIGVAVSQVRSETQTAEVMTRLGAEGVLHHDFRPVAASVESLADVLTNGVLLGDQADRQDLLAVRLSKAIVDQNDQAYFVPSYLGDSVPGNAEPTGEVSILGKRASPNTLGAASNWLNIRGVRVMYVYSNLGLSLGKQLSEGGFAFMGAQRVWRMALTGPFDQYLGQLSA